MRSATLIAFMGVLLCIHETKAVTRENILDICRRRVPMAKCAGEGWYTSGQHCIKLFKEPKSYYEAEVACRDAHKDGHLATMHHLGAYNRVLCLITRGSVTKLPVWVGATMENNRAHWIGGSMIRFARWDPGQPGEVGPDDKCLMMNSNVWGHWTFTQCCKDLAYVCAYKR